MLFFSYCTRFHVLFISSKEMDIKCEPGAGVALQHTRFDPCLNNMEDHSEQSALRPLYLIPLFDRYVHTAQREQFEKRRFQGG